MESDTPSVDRPSKTPLAVTIGVVLVAFVLTTGIITFSTLRRVTAGANPDSTALADYGPVPAFHLTERSGDPVSLADLRDRIWLADFIFTNCAGPCPLMTMHMCELQKALSDSTPVRFVSFTVDPDRDTPQALSEYADRFGASRQRWWFLTGDMVTITHVAVDGFHVGSREDPILHSTLFALVDRRGHIRGYYHSDDPDLIRHVTDDVAVLLRDRRA